MWKVILFLSRQLILPQGIVCILSMPVVLQAEVGGPKLFANAASAKPLIRRDNTNIGLPAKAPPPGISDRCVTLAKCYLVNAGFGAPEMSALCAVGPKAGPLFAMSLRKEKPDDP